MDRPYQNRPLREISASIDKRYPNSLQSVTQNGHFCCIIKKTNLGQKDPNKTDYINTISIFKIMSRIGTEKFFPPIYRFKTLK